MPIYDFHCLSCDRIFERITRADALPDCPHCGAAQVEKLVSMPAAPGKSAAIIASGRRQAAREGLFSNYSKADKARAK
ncbi:zinc ribbon domain-containing protein [Zoogloea sp.]|uniref:FmdB family zinc ribbon protein n=1 Tax=Zoogloea sp. TaxID=49181 RepID=UPI0025F0A960|nr:zinc ribbon domain-containing protein [Zoogloea sp.]MCK6393683.1 zinc ribbon domain-containing protein [Zoogloea sp.]